MLLAINQGLTNSAISIWSQHDMINFELFKIKKSIPPVNAINLVTTKLSELCDEFDITAIALSQLSNSELKKRETTSAGLFHVIQNNCITAGIACQDFSRPTINKIATGNGIVNKTEIVMALPDDAFDAFIDYTYCQKKLTHLAFSYWIAQCWFAHNG